MAFTTLEQRFSQISKQIYNRYSPSGDQYISIKPDTNGPFGSNSRIANDNRSVPVVSTVRDVKRVTQFWNSPQGRLFVGKQLLLQTGNTFAETRLYNPVNIILTAVPFIGTGITRHVGKPIRQLKTPTRNLRGALQQETLDKFSTDAKKGGLVAQLKSAVVSPFAAYKYEPKFTNHFNEPSKEYYIRPEDLNLYGRTLNLEWTPGSNRFNGSYLDVSVYSDLGPKLFQVQPLSDRGNIKTTRAVSIGFVDRFVKYGTQQVNPTVRGSKTFKELENTLQTNGYFAGKSLDVQNLSPTIDNVSLTSQTVTGTTVKVPTVLDPYNSVLGIGLPVTPVQGSTQRDQQNAVEGVVLAPKIYKDIMGDPKVGSSIYNEETKSDIIKFIFKTAEPNANPVHFRAFLSTIKENVKPEFTEQRYIGRTERFVTYGGAKRTSTFTFNIVSFGAMETDQIWKRVNYLTGLAFPKGYSESGFMIPPLFRITIGGIYEDQPCYIDTLDYDFLDPTITFDIDKEVSQVVNVSMGITLLEKRSKYYDSPFYAITENLQGA